MLLSGYTVFSLTYFLPTGLGAHLEFYFLELVALALNLTLCVIFTSYFMQYFELRDRQNNRGDQEGQEEGEREDQASRNKGKNNMIVQILNLMVLLLVMLGCKFESLKLCFPSRSLLLSLLFQPSMAI